MFCPSVLWTFLGCASQIVDSPLLWNDRVIFGGEDRSLYAVSIASGSLLWTFKAEAKFTAGGVLIGGKALDTVLAIDVEAGQLHALAAATGVALWAYSGANSPTPAVSLDGSTVYVVGQVQGSLASSLVALDAGSGAVLWSTSLDDGSDSSPVVGPTGAVYVVVTVGQVLAVGSSGATL